MNQKHHIETVHLKTLRRSHWLLKSFLIVVSIFALYLIVVLVSYSPFDPSWSQSTWSGPIHNSGGGLGAWFADILLLTVGALAYALPLIMLCFCWIAFTQLDRRNFVDHFGLVLRTIGSLMLLITSCGLAALNINDHDYFASGGIIGIVLSHAMLTWFNVKSATLVLLCVWSVGLTLFPIWSWFTIAETIGALVLGCVIFVFNLISRHDNDHKRGRSR